MSDGWQKTQKAHRQICTLGGNVLQCVLQCVLQLFDKRFNIFFPNPDCAFKINVS